MNCFFYKESKSEKKIFFLEGGGGGGGGWRWLDRQTGLNQFAPSTSLQLGA